MDAYRIEYPHLCRSVFTGDLFNGPSYISYYMHMHEWLRTNIGTEAYIRMSWDDEFILSTIEGIAFSVRFKYKEDAVLYKMTFG